MALGKHHALSFTHSKTVYTAPLQLLVCDLWGPSYINSSNGFRFYISCVDVYSRFTWIYFLQNKSQAFQAFQKFKIIMEKLLGVPILRVQTDGGDEFSPSVPFFKDHGIEHSW